MKVIFMRTLWQRLSAANRGPLILIVLFVALLPLANPRVYATDEVQYYVYLRSLRFDGDLNFANDYQEFARRNPKSGIEGSLLQANRIRPNTGLYGNIAPIGCAIMWAPFFLLADAGVSVAHLFGSQIPADGFSPPYILSVCYASALYGLLGLLLCWRLATRYASQTAATAATIAIWLASPLVFYMFIQMPFAHATGFFLTTLFLTIWHDTRNSANTALVDHRSWRAWLALALVGGLMTMTREQLGLFLLLPVVEGLSSYWQILRGKQWAMALRLVLRHGMFAVVFVGSLLPQVAVYQILNGEPKPASEVSGRINWCSPHFVDTLIDYHPTTSFWCHTTGDFTIDFPNFSRGALVWSPILLFGFAGLLLLWRKDRGLMGALLLVFLAQTYINGAYGTTWHLRGAFGFRRLIECTPIAVIGLVLVLDRCAARVGWGWVLLPLGLLVAWNGGLILNATFFENETSLRRIGLIWPDVIRWQIEAPFKVLGRIGDILFNRCRFLQNGKC
jgi:hypothetical protein